MTYPNAGQPQYDHVHWQPPAQPQQFPPFPGSQPPQQFPGVPDGQFPPAGLPPFPTQPAPQDIQTGSVSDFLAGGGKSISFGNAASGFKRLNKPFGGKVISARTAPVTKMDTREIDRWPDGRIREQLVVTLDTLAGPYPEREDANDDGKRTLYVKGGMVDTFRRAVQQGNGGSTELKPGGMLIGCHTGHKPGKNGGVQYLYAFMWDPTGTVPQGAPAAQQPVQPGEFVNTNPVMQQINGPAYHTGPPTIVPPAQPQPVAVPAAPTVMDQPGMAEAFAAWQAQQAGQQTPQQPAPAQPGAAFNPFAQ